MTGAQASGAAAAAAAAAELAERLVGVRARVEKGGFGNLQAAVQELRGLRRQPGATAGAVAELLGGVYSEVLAQCRHKGGAAAFATRLLPVAREAALLALRDAPADTGLRREAQSVLRAVARNGDARGAVRLLEALCAIQEREGQTGVVAAVDEQLFFTAIKCCGAASPAPQLEIVEGLLRRMRALGVAKSAFVYSAAFKAYANGGPAWIPQVEALAAEMLSCAAAPTAAPAPTSAKQALAGKKGAAAAATTAAAGLDLVALNSLLDAYARCGGAARALVLLERMEGKRLVVRVGETQDGAVGRAEEDEDGRSQRRRQLGKQGQEGESGAVLPRPDAFTYNIVLRALGESGDVPGMLMLYDRMQQRGVGGGGSGGGVGVSVAPDAVTVNTVVAACARAGSLGRALVVLRSSPVPASVEGYSALVHAFASRGDVGGAQEVLAAMEAAGVRPNARTYASLMRAAAVGGDAARPSELLRMMALQGEMDPSVRPTAWTVNPALSELVARGQLAAALELREEMAALGVAPDTATCNALLDGFLGKAEPPRVREAEALFMEMLESGPSPDAYTFATLLAAHQPPPPPPPRARPPNPVDLLQRLPGLLGKRDENEEEGEEEEAPGSVGGGGGAGIAAAAAAAAAPLGILPGPDRVLEMVRLRNRQHALARAQGSVAAAAAASFPPPVVLDTTAVNTLLAAYMREGAVRQALAAFEDFKRGNLTSPALALAPDGGGDASMVEEALRPLLVPGRPDVMTYTVLVKGVAQTDNIYAGQKIMALYREMRGRFGVAPDSQLAYALVNSFVRTRSRVAGLEMEDLEEVFADLRQLGWRADTLERLERRAESFLLQGLYSEAWKEGGEQRRARPPQPLTTAEKLFQKYNWNKIDSGFFGF